MQAAVLMGLCFGLAFGLGQRCGVTDICGNVPLFSKRKLTRFDAHSIHRKS